jgi:hypothetical protein
MMTLADVGTPDPTSFAAGWGTLSLVNAGLAQSKGRSGLLWWLFSLLLGPIATFLIVILPNIHTEALAVTDRPTTR